MAESFFMSNSGNPHKDCHSPNVSILSEVEMVKQGGEEGAEGGSSGENLQNADAFGSSAGTTFVIARGHSN